jgi:hypothetical protein
MFHRSESWRTVALALLLGSCSGANISPEHFDEGLGNAPPVPQSGGVGPVEVAIDLPTNDFTIPSRPPALLEAYRLSLVERAHVLPPDQAEAYADAEIAALQREFAGRPADLVEELRLRLQPPLAVPGDRETVVQEGPVFPPDPIVTHGAHPGDDS